MRRPRLLFLLPVAAALLAAGCGASSSGPSLPKVSAAKTVQLAGFEPARPVEPGHPTSVSFVIRQPSGAPLTDYRRGAGPHTGIHLILVRSDLGVLLHYHPRVGADGKVTDRIVFPADGRYRVVVDAYPNAPGLQRNFQLFDWITVGRALPHRPPPAFRRSLTLDGMNVTLHGHPSLRAIQPAFLRVTVRDASGRPAVVTPWLGALAHAIFFRAGSFDYFHTHVCSAGASGCTSQLRGTSVTGTPSGPGELRVGVLVPVPGLWRLFLQFRANGHLLTAPFTLTVR